MALVIGARLRSRSVVGAPEGAVTLDYSSEVVGGDSEHDREILAKSSDKREQLRPLPVGGLAKRIPDITLALFLIVAFLPLLLMVAAAVKLSSRGPVFFGHTRIGHGGKPFKCWKFRTMVTDGDAVLERHLSQNPEARTEWERDLKLRRDPRVTPFGQVLRVYSVDELPQFFNVLLGDMSFVGPRPVTHDELGRYGPAAEAYLAARPGITGLWQTSGRSDTTYEQRIEMDRAYATEWTFVLDIVIMLRTIPVVLGAKGSC